MTGKRQTKSGPVCARAKCGKVLFAPINCKVCDCIFGFSNRHLTQTHLSSYSELQPAVLSLAPIPRRSQLYLDHHRHTSLFCIQACIATHFGVFEQGLGYQLPNSRSCQEEVGCHIYAIHFIILSSQASARGASVNTFEFTLKSPIISFH